MKTYSPRPLTSRALKSAMDVLRPLMTGATVLDLFAGQGRFAEAALKEGAESVVLVESNRDTARQLLKTFQKSPAQIKTQDVFLFLEHNTEPFDIVFADPPFELWNPEFQQKLFEAATQSARKSSILLVKYPKRMVASETIGNFHLFKTSVFGDSQLLYYRYGTD